MICFIAPGYCRWVGLIIGFTLRRFAGAIAGYFLGALIDSLWRNSSFRFTYGSTTHTYGRQTTPPPRTNPLQDAYDELGIRPDATDDEVRAAYKRLAMLYHPDRASNLGDDVRGEAERRFKRINEARDRIFQARGMK